MSFSRLILPALAAAFLTTASFAADAPPSSPPHGDHMGGAMSFLTPEERMMLFTQMRGETVGMTDEQRQAMVAIPVYARSRIGKDQEYTKHAASWLNGKYFETIAVPRPIQPQTTINIHWPSVMKLYRITSNWRQEHGPAPGMKNCRVPKEYLSDM